MGGRAVGRLPAGSSACRARNGTFVAERSAGAYPGSRDRPSPRLTVRVRAGGGDLARGQLRRRPPIRGAGAVRATGTTAWAIQRIPARPRGGRRTSPAQGGHLDL